MPSPTPPTPPTPRIILDRRPTYQPTSSVRPSVRTSRPTERPTDRTLSLQTTTTGEEPTLKKEGKFRIESVSIDRTPDRALARIDLSVASHPVVVDPVALVDPVVVVVPSIRAAVYRTKRPSSTNERTEPSSSSSRPFRRGQRTRAKTKNTWVCIPYFI